MYDPLHRPLGDSDFFGHVAESDLRVAGQQQQHVRVIT
jgi:hypothetical protein